MTQTTYDRIIAPPPEEEEAPAVDRDDEDDDRDDRDDRDKRKRSRNWSYDEAASILALLFSGRG